MKAMNPEIWFLVVRAKRHMNSGQSHIWHISHTLKPSEKKKSFSPIKPSGEKDQEECLLYKLKVRPNSKWGLLNSSNYRINFKKQFFFQGERIVVILL